MQKTSKSPTDEIRGRECADYIREFCAEQRAAAAEYIRREQKRDENNNSSGSLFINPS